MHVKYRQDNLYRMTWYTGICGSDDYGLTIHVSFMVKCVRYVRAMDPLVSIGWTTLVGVGHSRLDSIVPLTLRMICYAMAGALALYNRSLRTAFVKPQVLKVKRLGAIVTYS
jgi:hypothetical protein